MSERNIAEILRTLNELSAVAYRTDATVNAMREEGKNRSARMDKIEADVSRLGKKMTWLSGAIAGVGAVAGFIFKAKIG